MDVQDVIALTDENNVLNITGDGNDNVELSGFTQVNGTNEYTASFGNDQTVTLFVDGISAANVDVSVSGV